MFRTIWIIRKADRCTPARRVFHAIVHVFFGTARTFLPISPGKISRACYVIAASRKRAVCNLLFAGRNAYFVDQMNEKQEDVNSPARGRNTLRLRM
jgi:hypothetical protein